MIGYASHERPSWPFAVPPRPPKKPWRKYVLIGIFLAVYVVVLLKWSGPLFWRDVEHVFGGGGR